MSLVSCTLHSSYRPLYVICQSSYWRPWRLANIKVDYKSSQKYMTQDNWISGALSIIWHNVFHIYRQLLNQNVIDRQSNIWVLATKASQCTRKLPPYGRLFISPAEGCSLRLHRCGPSGPPESVENTFEGDSWSREVPIGDWWLVAGDRWLDPILLTLILLLVIHTHYIITKKAPKILKHPPPLRRTGQRLGPRGGCIITSFGCFIWMILTVFISMKILVWIKFMN